MRKLDLLIAEVATALVDEPPGVHEPDAAGRLIAIHPRLRHGLHHEPCGAQVGLPGPVEQEPRTMERRDAVHAQAAQHGGNHGRRRALNVVVEDAHVALAVAMQDVLRETERAQLARQSTSRITSQHVALHGTAARLWRKLRVSAVTQAVEAPKSSKCTIREAP